MLTNSFIASSLLIPTLSESYQSESGGSQDLRSRNWAVLGNGNQSVHADDESPEGAITLSPKIVPDQNPLDFNKHEIVHSYRFHSNKPEGRKKEQPDLEKVAGAWGFRDTIT